jgi:F0F1-type ATP synthase delta subunit
MNKLSRSKLAKYTAQRIIDGQSDQALKELAAYLIESGRIRETDLVVRAIYEELEVAGVVVADVTSVDGIDASVQTELQKLVGADTFVVNQSTEPDVLGGVLLRTPTKVLDATFRRRLGKLRERKV